MIFYITTKVMNGIQTSGVVTHWLIAYAVFSAANLLVPQFIRFFTIPSNLLTFWLMSALMSFIAIYLMSALLSGIEVGETNLNQIGLGIISINLQNLTPLLTMVVAGIFAGTFSTLLHWLNE
jgi:uncharacterized membrane protein YvlD (DUF360 family)